MWPSSFFVSVECQIICKELQLHILKFAIIRYLATVIATNQTHVMPKRPCSFQMCLRQTLLLEPTMPTTQLSYDISDKALLIWVYVHIDSYICILVHSHMKLVCIFTLHILDRISPDSERDSIINYIEYCCICMTDPEAWMHASNSFYCMLNSMVFQ